MIGPNRLKFRFLAGARHLYLMLEKTLREELDTAPQPELQTFSHSLTPPKS